MGNPRDWRTRVYSLALKNILAAGSHIYADVLVISEFINRCARLHYGRLPVAKRPPDFKSFRGSSGFQAIASDIGSTVRRFLAHCDLIESGFSTVDMDAVLTDYQSGGSDFNDSILTELCKARGLTLVTHDSDFSGQGIDVLTGNQRMLP